MPQFSRNDPVPMSTDGILKTVLQIEQLLHSNKRWLHFLFLELTQAISILIDRRTNSIFLLFYHFFLPVSYPVLVGGNVKDMHYHHAAISSTDL